MISSVKLYDSNTPQINKIAGHPNSNMVCSAFENSSIKVFDFSGNKTVFTIDNAHSDSVSCVSYNKNGFEIISGSHDGSIKVWDLRKSSDSSTNWVPLCSVETAHEKKYDEGVQCIVVHPTQPFLASGGADSLVKMFEMYS